MDSQETSLSNAADWSIQLVRILSVLDRAEATILTLRDRADEMTLADLRSRIASARAQAAMLEAASGSFVEARDMPPFWSKILDGSGQCHGDQAEA